MDQYEKRRHELMVQEAREQRAKDEEKQAIADATEFGPQFVGVSFDTYEIYAGPKQREITDRCRAYAENADEMAKEGRGLILLGKPGTGKNHLLYSIVKAMRPKSVLYCEPFYRIIRRIKTNWTTHEVTEQDLIDIYIGYKFLALEEIGLQYGTDNEKLILSELIDYRYRYNRPTIVTSNLTLTKLVAFLDDQDYPRNSDRLMEKSDILVFDWPSYRKRRTEK